MVVLLMSLLPPDSQIAAKMLASPNHGERKGLIDALVLHYTGMDSAISALHWLCNPLSEVSCHYFVFEDGRVLQLVPEARRAWHAGRGLWADTTDMNSRSIGIEIDNPGHAGGAPPFPDAQVRATIALCRDIVARHAISPQRILAHSDIAPDRKQDPGEVFPWQQLHLAGIGHLVAPHPVAGGRCLGLGDQGAPVAELQAMLALYGYGIIASGLFDAHTQAVVTAFQRHFRPARVDGIADASSVATLRDLIAALPANLRPENLRPANRRPENFHPSNPRMPLGDQ